MKFLSWLERLVYFCFVRNNSLSLSIQYSSKHT
jgi:hypothetical protein